MLLRGMQTNDWDIHTLAFLRKHKYFTTYCQELLNQGKIKNIDILQRLVTDNNK
jgi:hypothetical protein